MKKMFVLMVVLAIVAVPAFAATNLLVNSDFETGDLTGWTTYAAGWGGANPIVQYDVAYEGAFAAKLSTSGGSGAIYQAITVQAGHQYTIDGYWKGSGASDWMEVLFFNDSGASIAAQLDESPLASSIIHKVDGWGQNPPNTFDWTQITGQWATAGPHTNTITATGTKIYVGLKAGASGGSVTTYFDGFKVTEVPEPSSMLALASGIGAMGFGLRRRIR